MLNARPLQNEAREKESANASPPIFQPVTTTKCNVKKSPGEVKPFTFDTVFDEHSTQDDVYEKVAKNIIEGALSGYNGTLFAYGQTGTGKTGAFGLPLIQQIDPSLTYPPP